MHEHYEKKKHILPCLMIKPAMSILIFQQVKETVKTIVILIFRYA